jgi:hypothetical protein
LRDRYGGVYALSDLGTPVRAATACGSEIHQQICCAACEEEIRTTDIGVRPGPGLAAG